MRLILSDNSKKKLFVLLKNKYDAKSIKELSLKINKSIKTLGGWFYLSGRGIPKEIIDSSWFNQLDILDEKAENWGMIKGGNISYLNAINKIGLSGIKKRQQLGGRRAALTKDKTEKEKFKVNIEDPLFLEFYGILMGDGFLSNFALKNKEVWLIGISTNLTLEKEYVKHYRKIVKKLFNRSGRLRERHENNVFEFIFSHKFLHKYLNEELNFPKGKKENLEIHRSIINLGFEKVKHTIRGIFDTDGSIYLERNKKGIPTYPIISIHMKEPIIIKQLKDILESEGFAVNYDSKNNMIKLKGKIQLKKWMDEIGSSNPYKLNKMNLALN